MKRIVAGWLLAIPAIASCEDGIPAGSWTTVTYVDATQQSQSSTYINSFLNKQLVVDQKSIKFAGDTCAIESEHRLQTDDEAAKFFLKEKTDYFALRLHAPVTYVDAECASIVVDQGGRKLLNWDGNFYLLD